MALLEIKNLSFSYPNSETLALNDINVKVERGDFVIISGESGCGKTTLLRLIKNTCSPNGKKEGNVFYNGKDISSFNLKENSEIGLVFQHADRQIVTDTVWHELAFGLENLGINENIAKKKISEVCTFFGINNYYNKKTNELSGGEKQLLALSSVLVMEPKLLLVDEATSSLDPIATIDFINQLERLNKELGITILLVTHSLDDVYDKANRLIILEKGKVIFDQYKKDINKNINKLDYKNRTILPIYIQMFLDKGYLPESINEARNLIDENINITPIIKKETNKETIIEVKHGYFRYYREGNDILKDLNIKIYKGEILSILGSNGVGKTTLVKVISGIRKLYSGKVLIDNKNIKKMSDYEIYHNNISVISQNPYSLFTNDKVIDELKEVSSIMGNNDEVDNIIDLVKIRNLLNKHPYDLSGGEAQKVALAKMLLFDPKIIILDEATKGLDNYYKNELANVLIKLKEEGKTVILVTHDMEFASIVSDRCALYFDGEIVSIDDKDEFFKDNSFFTTTVHKVTRGNYELVTLKDYLEMTNGK